MSKGLGLLVATILCFTFASERPAMADGVSAMAWTWGWGCPYVSQTGVGSTIASAFSHCVDTYDGGAESTGYTLVTRHLNTPLDNTIIVSAQSSAVNLDNTWAGATGSWSEWVNVYGGSGQGLLWMGYDISGSQDWGGGAIVDQACLQTIDLNYCFELSSPPWGALDVIPFTFGQPFELTASLDAAVVASFGYADASLEVGPPSYWFTDINGNPIRASFSPEPATLFLLGIGLMGFAGLTRNRRPRRRE
ncbi:MAG: PEP-CTERM sorting domain-containing protein [Terriglobia bacterium]